MGTGRWTGATLDDSFSTDVSLDAEIPSVAPDFSKSAGGISLVSIMAGWETTVRSALSGSRERREGSQGGGMAQVNDTRAMEVRGKEIEGRG